MATTQHNKKDTPAPVPSRQTVVLLFGTLLDTTIRLFVPVLFGLLAGLWIDEQAKTKPLYTLICVVIGVVISAVLIYKQIKSIDKEKV